MGRHDKAIPYLSQVNIVCSEVGYVPACAKTDFDELSLAQKRDTCAACLVRFECFTDAINNQLSQGGKPSSVKSSGFMAGFSDATLIEVAVKCYTNKKEYVSIDDAEELMTAAMLED